MTTDATLFAHIIPRLTDRTEDIAVEALGLYSVASGRRQARP